MSQTPPPHPDVLRALAAVETAGDAARQALAAIGAHGAAGGATAPATGIQDTALPFPGDADTDALLTAAYALSAQLSAGPRTPDGWSRVQRLAQWIADAAGYRHQDQGATG